MNLRSKSNRSTVGIVGSTGFIGSHLQKHFIQKNIPFVNFDGNALHQKAVKDYFSKHQISQIIFLIGAFDPPFDNLLTVNVLTLQRFIEIGLQHGLDKIIYCSSGAVYGEPKKRESFETDSLKPNTLYGLSKLLAEKSIEYYAQNTKIKYLILRFPNVYGENNKKGVIYHLLRDAKNGSITIAGDGNQKRNFLHVSDACIAIEKSLSYMRSDIFNISSPITLSINAVVKRLNSKFSFSIRHIPADNALKNLILNIDKAKKLLHFNAKVKDLKL